MSATSSFVRVLRLPRDLALIAVDIDPALIVINMGMFPLPSTPAADQMCSVYATPGVWVSMLAGIVMSLARVAVLAWPLLGGFALAWLFLAVKGLTGFYSGGAIGAYGLMLALLLVCLTMAVALMRSVTRRLYRRYL